MSDKRKRLPAFPLLGWIRRSSCLLPLSDERSEKVSLYSALARLYLFRRQSLWLLLQIVIEGCWHFLSVRPVPLGISGHLTLALIFLCCFDAPVISQHVFTSGHRILILCIYTQAFAFYHILCHLCHCLVSRPCYPKGTHTVYQVPNFG